MSVAGPRAALSFVVTAFVVSAVVGFVFGALGVPQDKLVLNAALIGVSIATVVAGMRVALRNNRPVTEADDIVRAAALAPPAVGEARLYIARRGFVGMAQGIDVAVDDGSARQLKSPRFTAFTVTPGHHTVSASVAKVRKTLAVDLGPGGIAVVRIVPRIGGLALREEPDATAARDALAGTRMVLS